MLNLDDILNQQKEIAEAVIKKERSGGAGADPRLLKLKIGGTYTLRLLYNPKAKAEEQIFATYKEVGFPSCHDGKYTYLGRSPQDVGVKNDPIKEAQWDSYSKAKERGDEPAMKRSYKLIPQRKQVSNWYVVNITGDDEQKELIGTNVVLKYPAQLDKEGNPSSDLYKKVDSAVLGEKQAKIGKKLFLLDGQGKLVANGKDFIIKVTKKADGNGGFWPNYSDSEFDDATEIKISAERAKEILENVHDLSEFIPEVKPTEEIKRILDEQWYGKNATNDEDIDTDDRPILNLDDTDDTDIPLGGSNSQSDDLDAMLESIK